MSKPHPMTLDKGIAYPVELLRKHGLETCQSCQGGKGHAYHEPTIDMFTSARDSEGFRALAVLTQHGVGVAAIAIVWNVLDGLPYERVWRIVLDRAYPEMAKRKP